MQRNHKQPTFTDPIVADLDGPRAAALARGDVYRDVTIGNEDFNVGVGRLLARPSVIAGA